MTASTRRGVLHTPRDVHARHDVHASHNNNDTNVHAGAFHDNNNIDVRNDRGVCNTPLRSPSNTVGVFFVEFFGVIIYIYMSTAKNVCLKIVYLPTKHYNQCPTTPTPIVVAASV